MRYNEKDIRAKIEQARKEKHRTETHIQKKEKSKIYGRIDEKIQNEKTEKVKTELTEKRNRFLIKMISSGIAAAMILSCIAYLGNLYMNKGKYTVNGVKNQTDCNISETSSEYADLGNYIRNVVFDEGEYAGAALNRIWSSTASPEIQKYGNDMLCYIRNRNFKISNVQIDRSSGCYYVMCDFNEKGNYYFVIQKMEKAFRLISVDFS